MSEPPPIVLNANQRRHFEVLLGRLEDSIAKIESLLVAESADDRILSLVADDLPEEFRASARETLGGVRTQIAELSVLLMLRPRNVSRRRTIAATLTSEAIRLEDSLSSQLQGYGALDPTVAQYLDPILSQMATILAALAARLRGA